MTTILTQRRLSRGLLLAVAAALWLAATGPASGDYTLQILAEVGDVIDGHTIEDFSREYTNVAINNDGEVAFFAGARGPEGAGWSVMTQRRFIAGAGKAVDGTVPRFNAEDHQVDINNSGQVVYTAYLPQGGRGLFVNEELLLQPGDTVDGRTLTTIFRYPQINDAGTVVFDATYNGQYDLAIFTQTDAVVRRGTILDGYTLGEAMFPRIGNNGAIAAFGFLQETAGREAIVTPTRIILNVGDVIDDVSVGRIDGLGVVTNGGEIVMSIKGGAWPDWQEYVVTEDRILFGPRDIIAGHMVGWLTGTNVVLNNRNELALLGALLNASGGYAGDALFAGGRLVALEGDLVDGKVITEVFPNFDMNDRRDVAFRVAFHDGSRAVLLATVPEPSSCFLAAFLLIVCVSLLW